MLGRDTVHTNVDLKQAFLAAIVSSCIEPSI
jgi:hypothetical protein